MPELASAIGLLFGKEAGLKLIKSLSNRPNGAQRFAQAARAVAEGTSAVEALKSVFGNEAFDSMNEALGKPPGGQFTFEAGVSNYIKVDAESTSPIATLRDELNLNLDRISVIDTNKAGLKNQFRGAFHVWKARYRELAPELYNEDALNTFVAIDRLLDDSKKSFKDVYKIAGATTIGTGGALLLISGVLLATGTGFGVVAAISSFLFGIPWLSVGALVIPGALLLALAAIPLQDDQAMSTSVQFAYKLLDRQAVQAQSNLSTQT